MSKVILVTGASSGIGAASAEKLISEGHIVYCAARSTSKMQDLKQKGAIPLAMDVTKHETITSGINQIIHEQGKIDVLFNNAGFGQYGAVEETSIETARYQFEVNLFGLARVTQLVLPHMRQQKSGTIINTSSIGGKIYTPLGAWYHATKHALEGWSDSLRLELASFNINVVIVEPGLIDTNFYHVLQDNIPANSNKSPYKKITQGLEQAYQNGSFTGSPPTVIADVIARIVNTRHPKTRYAAGRMARSVLFLRKWLSDRMFDRIIMNQMQN